MKDPLQLYEKEFERSMKSPFRCLQHGDIWHNNCLFKHLATNVKFALVDWQVSKIIAFDAPPASKL